MLTYKKYSLRESVLIYTFIIKVLITTRRYYIALTDFFFRLELLGFYEKFLCFVFFCLCFIQIFNFLQVKEPPSIDFDNVNDNINSLSTTTNTDNNNNGTNSKKEDDAQLQKLARFALAVGSVMNSKGKSSSSLDDDENEKMLNVRRILLSLLLYI